MGKVRAELVTPPPDRFVADDHAALEEQLFDIPQAQLKSEIPAHRATDDGVWKTMAVVKGLGCLHRSTLPASIVTVTMPCRRLWKNCERKLHTSLQFVVLAFIALLLRRY